MLKDLFDATLSTEVQRRALSYLCLPPFRNYDIILFKGRYYICKQKEVELFADYLKEIIKTLDFFHNVCYYIHVARIRLQIKEVLKCL